MASPQELEAAAGIEPASELERKRIWAGAQAHASGHGRAPGVEDLQLSERMLNAARAIEGERLAGGQGRAVITLLDAGEEIEVSLEFQPDLEQVGESEYAGTPAQIRALEILEMLSADDADAEE
jgi:hypothetical protein